MATRCGLTSIPPSGVTSGAKGVGSGLGHGTEEPENASRSGVQRGAPRGRLGQAGESSHEFGDPKRHQDLSFVLQALGQTGTFAPVRVESVLGELPGLLAPSWANTATGGCWSVRLSRAVFTNALSTLCVCEPPVVHASINTSKYLQKVSFSCEIPSGFTRTTRVERTSSRTWSVTYTELKPQCWQIMMVLGKF